MLRIVNWNVEWAKPASHRYRIIAKKIIAANPDILCITEGYEAILPEHGYTLLAPAIWCSDPVPGRHKIMLWSKTPWKEIDVMGLASLPPGRFVRGTTETAIGTLTIFGAAIPYMFSNVATGTKNRKAAEDHIIYLAGLRWLLSKHLRKQKHSTLIIGDFNQQHPRRKGDMLYAAEELTLTFQAQNLIIATEGIIPGIERATIDHLVHTSDLTVTTLTGWHNMEGDIRLSDHPGIYMELKRL